MSPEGHQEIAACEIEQQVENTIVHLRDSVPVANDNNDDQTGNNLKLLQDIRESIANGETGAAWLFAKMNRGRFVFDHSSGRWFEWQENFWKEDLKNCVVAAIDELVDLYKRRAASIAKERLIAKKQGQKKMANNLKSKEETVRKRIRALQSKNGLMNALKLASVDWTIRNRISIAITGDEWDSKPDLLGCLNGVIDLRNGDLRSGYPEDYIKSVAQTEYHGIDVSAPQWENFLSEIYNGDSELVLYMQRLLGYCITGYTSEHIFPIFWGSGRNGKSTLIEVLGNVLGPDLSGPIQSEMILDQGRLARSGGPTSDIMALRGKRIVWGSETDEGRRLNIGKLKWLTGGDTLTGRPPYGKHQISFKAIHKLILLTNHRPHAPANDYALWARIHLIPFTQSFVENPEMDNEHEVDPNLPARLREEASGILAWLVRGTLMWREEALNPPDVVRAATENYRSEEDYIGQFIDEQCYIDPEVSQTAGELYRAYRNWSEENGLKPISNVKFSRRLRDSYDRDDSSRHVVYHGLHLID
jgi:putative DNA primase/helicase